MTAPPVAILGCGMATAVGLTAPATCAAVRAGIAGFRDTRYVALGGDALIGAEVPLSRRLQGLARLVRLVVGPIGECLKLEATLMPEEVPLLLGVSEGARPGRSPELDEKLLPMIEHAMRAKFHHSSRLLPLGRIAGALCIREATKLIAQHGFRRVVVAGVDSYLLRDTVEDFEDRERLLTPRNSNGFIPGEAGAALLLGPDDGSIGLRVLSFGYAVESATIEADHPLRGEALASAYRDALADARIGLHDIDYRIVDCTGEQYWFKEAAFAFARLMRVRREYQDVWTPADCLGEVGAAATPSMIGIAWYAACKNYAPGPLVLIQASSDDGCRAAIIMTRRY